MPKGVEYRGIPAAVVPGAIEIPSPPSLIGGLPKGGTTHEVLAKRSGKDFDVEWDTLTIQAQLQSPLFGAVILDSHYGVLFTESGQRIYLDILAPLRTVQFATAAALPTCTYNNGTSGVGATLTATANGALTVDGSSVSGTAGHFDRVLVKNQADATQNGVYTCIQSGDASHPWILQRAGDNDNSNWFAGQVYLVMFGTANTGTVWYSANNAPVIGTDTIPWAQLVLASGGGGLTSPLTTKGDLWIYDSANDRFGVGSNGQVLSADSTQSAGLKWNTAAGDVSGPITALVVGKLQGRAVSSAVPSDGNVLTWVAANSDWEPVAPTGGSGATGSFSRLSGTTSLILGADNTKLYGVVFDNAGRSLSVTLPAPGSHHNPIVVYVKQSGAGGHSIMPNGSETIDGVAGSLTVYQSPGAGQYRGVTLWSDGTNWYTTGRTAD